MRSRCEHEQSFSGDFKDSETLLRWLRAHEEVATWDLTDDTFESRTDSHSPDEGAIDWFVMFYDADEGNSNAFVPLWETVAHKLVIKNDKISTRLIQTARPRERRKD